MALHLSSRRKFFGFAMLAMALAVPTVIAYILGIETEERLNLLHLGIIVLPPFAAFAFLGFRALFFRNSSPFPALLGSALGAFLAVAVPYGWAWHRIHHYTGGGADIGMGLVLLPVPFYIICAMMIGWFLGTGVLSRPSSHD